MALYTKCSVCKKKIPIGTLCECSKERHKEYNKRVRYREDNKKYAEFYNSAAWHKMIDYIKTKYNGLCLMCLIKHDHIVPSDVIHHIEELRENFDKRLVEDNLISLCHRCHNSLHSSYSRQIKEDIKNLLETYKEKFI
jgi:5-methylcytosine-specific restriction enzyme A